MSYVNPLPGVKYTLGRVDQGLDVDAPGFVGSPIVAVGKARIVSITSDPTGFGRYVAYKLLDGPAKGRVIYVGHSDIAPGLRVGEVVQAGEPIALIKGLGPGAKPGHIEMGWADPSNPNLPLAHGVKGGEIGQSFATFFEQGSVSADTTTTPPTAPPATKTAGDLIANDFSPNSPMLANVEQPGTGIPGSTPPWQQLASLPGASPDTVRMAQLSGS